MIITEKFTVKYFLKTAAQTVRFCCETPGNSVRRKTWGALRRRSFAPGKPRVVECSGGLRRTRQPLRTRHWRHCQCLFTSACRHRIGSNGAVAALSTGGATGVAPHIQGVHEAVALEHAALGQNDEP